MSGSDSDDVFSYGGRKAPPPLQRAAAATAPLSDEAAQHAHLPRGGRPRKRARSGLEVVMLVDGDDEEEAIVLPSAAEPVAAAMGGNEWVVRLERLVSPKAPHAKLIAAASSVGQRSICAALVGAAGCAAAQPAGAGGAPEACHS